MKLKELAALFAASRVTGGANVEITGVETDSRKVQPGNLFICLPGFRTDGHDHAAKAVAQGAAALVVEREVGLDIPTLHVKDSRFAMAVIASHYFGYPSSEMKVIGITGTNGKTTMTHIIEKILGDRGHRTGLMGTIRMTVGGESVATENTTQEALEVQRNLRRMRAAGADYAIMEVSSHALDLGRVKGVRFRTAVFTNLTQDHLDFHKTMEEYRAAKGLFFSRLGNEFAAEEERRSYAVLNIDDPAYDYFSSRTAVQVVTYGLSERADVRATDIRVSGKGTEFRLATPQGEEQVRLKLIGKFNVYNALGAVAAAMLEGVPLTDIKNSLEEMAIVDGRMEPVDAGQPFLAVVDYAHTPDGLENALTTIAEFAEGRVLTVFGCGGDRDRTKRPVMGRIAAKYSDYVYVTSDNPRTENPEAILREIKPGVLEELPDDKCEFVADRRAAIQRAVAQAGPGDVILIAGKGHESYQEIDGVKAHFDDREETSAAIRGLNQP